MLGFCVRVKTLTRRAMQLPETRTFERGQLVTASGTRNCGRKGGGGAVDLLIAPQFCLSKAV